MADDSASLSSSVGGLLRLVDPQLLMSLGFGLMAGAKYGSNAGEGLMQGMQMYTGLKTNQLQQQLMHQQIQSGNIANQRQQMMLSAAQQALGGDQGQGSPAPTSAAPAAPQPNTPFLPGISPMAPGAPAGVSVPPTAAPQGAPGLTPPSMEQIYGATYPGSVNPHYMQAMAMFSQDPAAALLKVREDQLKSAQQQYAPALAKLDTLIKSDKPAAYLKADPQLSAAWPQLAQTLGFDAQKDYNDQNVRMALTHVRNQIAGSLQEPTVAPVLPEETIHGDLGSIYQRDPLTGKMTQVKGEEPLKDVLIGGQPTAVRASQAEGKQPFNQVTYGSAQFAGGPGALMAALASRGVSLPAGFRSQQQQLALLNGLIQRYPNSSPDEIADQIRTGQLDFNGAKRTTAQLSTLAGAADIQSRKIEKDLGSLGQLIPKLPGGPAKLATWMTNLQKDWSWNGDKDSTQAVGYVKELAGEYAKLVSGSTGVAAPPEGEMKSALGLMQSALTKNGYEGMHDFLLQTSQNRRDAVREGLQSAATPGFSTGQAPPQPSSQPPAGNAPVRVKSPQEALALKPGTIFITPDGRTKVR